MNGIQAGMGGARKSASRNVAMIERLAQVAKDLAKKHYATGITSSDIRLEAYRLNLLTGQEYGRALSYMSAVPAAAGLVKTGQYRRSTMRVTHGNLQRVWMHPDHADIRPYLDS